MAGIEYFAEGRRSSSAVDGEMTEKLSCIRDTSSFDDRIEALWEHARRPCAAMVIRDQRYLDWRYRGRPDASYFLYGVERGAELAGILVARLATYRGMRWGYLVDFLAPENSLAALAALVDEALDELRRLDGAAVACFATDRSSKNTQVPVFAGAPASVCAARNEPGRRMVCSDTISLRVCSL